MARIPFTLEAWLKDKSQKVVDEDGDSVDPRVCSIGWLLESQDRLFIVTPEPELTEFEKSLADVIVYAISQSVVEPGHEIYKFVKDWSERLLDAAKKELCKGCASNLEGYIKGRHDALKEMEYKHEGPTIPAPAPVPVPVFWPPCHYGGECTNPFHDCINCHRQSMDGISTTTGTSSNLKAQNNE